jgi:hypothetical protein
VKSFHSAFLLCAHVNAINFILLAPRALLRRFDTLWVITEQRVKALLMQIFLAERVSKLVACIVVFMTRVAVSQVFPDDVLRTGIPVCAKGSPVGSPLFLWPRPLQAFLFAMTRLLHQPECLLASHQSQMALDCDHPFQRR